jgi:hypothetical protein
MIVGKRLLMTEGTDGVSITELVRAVFMCAFSTLIHEEYVHLDHCSVF